MKRILSVLFAIILASVLSLTSLAEGNSDGSWYCPKCGLLNHDSFCPKDGTPKPDSVSDGSFSGQSDSVVPVFTDLYPGVSVKLHPLTGESRAYSYAGPGSHYLSSGGYKPYKQRKIIAFFNENGWVYAYIQYATAEDRYVYFKQSAFEGRAVNVPVTSKLESVAGTVIADTVPSWGPSKDFNLLTHYRVPSGTSVDVFFQANGYAYAEFIREGTAMRMWLPAKDISIPGVALSITNDPSMQTGVSRWGLPANERPAAQDNDPSDNNDGGSGDDASESSGAATETAPQSTNNESPDTPESNPQPAENHNNQQTTDTSAPADSDDDGEDWGEWF